MRRNMNVNETIHRLNDSLIELTRSDSYATFFYGILTELLPISKVLFFVLDLLEENLDLLLILNPFSDVIYMGFFELALVLKVLLVFLLKVLQLLYYLHI